MWRPAARAARYLLVLRKAIRPGSTVVIAPNKIILGRLLFVSLE